MRINKLLLPFFIILVFVLPLACQAVNDKKVLLTADQPFDQNWQALGNDIVINQQEQRFLLASDGNTSLVYPLDFGYKNFDELIISLSSDQDMKIIIFPLIVDSATYSFEFEQKVMAGAGLKDYHFSLHHPSFKEVNNICINFTSEKPVNIVLKEISLIKKRPIQVLAQIFQDYFMVGAYSFNTVNIFSVPLVFGHPAFIYFLPIFIILLAFLIFSKKNKKLALICLLILWLICDLRMVYNFFHYQRTDYQTWIKPAASEKVFRTTGDFYFFISWLKTNLPKNTTAVNFYFGEKLHLFGILKYYLYPIEVYQHENQSDIYVIYYQSDIIYNQQDNRLYQGEQAISRPGKIIASTTGDDFFIFITNDNE